MSLVTKWNTGPDANTVHAQIRWDEPGDTGAAIKFDLRVRRIQDEPAKDTDARTVKEAIRAAHSFLKMQENPSGS